MPSLHFLCIIASYLLVATHSLSVEDEAFCVSDSLRSYQNGRYEFDSWDTSLDASLFYNADNNLYLFPFNVSVDDQQYLIGFDPAVFSGYSHCTSWQATYDLDPRHCVRHWHTLDMSSSWTDDTDMRLSLCNGICVDFGGTSSELATFNGMYAWDHYELDHNRSTYNSSTDPYNQIQLSLSADASEWMLLNHSTQQLIGSTDINITYCPSTGCAACASQTPSSTSIDPTLLTLTSKTESTADVEENNSVTTQTMLIEVESEQPTMRPSLHPTLTIVREQAVQTQGTIESTELHVALETTAVNQQVLTLIVLSLSVIVLLIVIAVVIGKCLYKDKATTKDTTKGATTETKGAGADRRSRLASNTNRTTITSPSAPTTIPEEAAQQLDDIWNSYHPTPPINTVARITITATSIQTTDFHDITPRNSGISSDFPTPSSVRINSSFGDTVRNIEEGESDNASLSAEDMYDVHQAAQTGPTLQGE